METINGARPINPIITENAKSELICVEIGLTKREYFAGVALQGILSNRWSMEFGNYNEEQKAEKAIRQADELLKQLEKK